jgi:biopolymer transport protein ExbB
MLTLLKEQLASSGGPVLVALFVISVLAGAIAIYKLLQFRKAGVGRIRPAEEAIALWERGDTSGAIERASRGGCPAAAAAAGAMTSLAEFPGDVDRARDFAAHVAMSHLNLLSRHLRFLETVAQAAPMLGLLGTVIGMISAFAELSAKGGAIDPSALAGGIWIALITTAAGLAVAIPAYFLSMWFEARVDQERSTLDAVIARVLFSVPPTKRETAPEDTPMVRMPRAAIPAAFGG